MKNDIGGLPYQEAELDGDGQAIGAPPQVPAGITDLIVVSHGWNNDRAAAETLYTRLFENFARVTAGDAAVAGRRLAIIGVIWPSKKFDDFVTLANADTSAGDPQVGGAASTGRGVDTAASEAAMRAAITRAAPVFDAPGDAERIATLMRLVPDLEQDGDAQATFVRTLRALLDPDGAAASAQTREDGADVFHRAPPDLIFERASDPALTARTAAVQRTAVAPDDDATGRAAGLGNFLAGAVHGVTNLMNLTTYFKMKARAGTVGAVGVAPMIDALAGRVERIHLVGHSFGGRVVTAAAAQSKTDKLHSLTLLQAAFSHNGFSKKAIKGFFRGVVDERRIRGPIVVTHTKNDKAVGVAYPIASRIGRSNSEGFGDADDQFGGIGSNGAQQLEDGELAVGADRLLDVGGAYVLEPGKFHNLESSAFIVAPDGGDAHGFVYVPQVAWVLSRAIVS